MVHLILLVSSGWLHLGSEGQCPLRKPVCAARQMGSLQCSKTQTQVFSCRLGLCPLSVILPTFEHHSIVLLHIERQLSEFLIGEVRCLLQAEVPFRPDDDQFLLFG